MAFERVSAIAVDEKTFVMYDRNNFQCSTALDTWMRRRADQHK